jgi:diacylglycerol kinase (ATP)
MASTERRGLRQIIKAFGYSRQGLAAAWRHEASFRLEAQLLVLLIPLGIWLGASGVERALLIGSAMLVPAMELMNGGLEAIVDKTTPEQHELAGRAKDMGSAAVFICMLICAATWLLILLPRIVSWA